MLKESMRNMSTCWTNMKSILTTACILSSPHRREARLESETLGNQSLLEQKKGCHYEDNKDFSSCLSAQQRSQLANAGCKVCSCCGETKSEMEYFKEGIYNKGVFGGLICKQWTEGLFRTRHMRIDCYSCSTCGAQWESEAYEIE